MFRFIPRKNNVLYSMEESKYVHAHFQIIPALGDLTKRRSISYLMLDSSIYFSIYRYAANVEIIFDTLKYICLAL